MAEMSSTKLVDTECPGCHKKFGTAVDISEIVVGHVQKEKEPAQLPDIDAIVDKKLKDREPKEPPKPKETEVPSYLPKHFCKGKDCDGHDNKARKRVTKKCTDCDQVAPENAGKCAFCGNKDFDELDEDDLERYNAGLSHDHEHE